MAAALSKMKIKACMLINIATGLFGFYILETRHVFSLPGPMNAALLSKAAQLHYFVKFPYRLSLNSFVRMDNFNTPN